MEKLFEEITPIYEVTFYDNKNKISDDNIDDKDGFFDRIHHKYNLNNGFCHIETVGMNEEVFKENYGNPFANVHMSRKTVTVTKDGDKVSIKVFRYIRNRRVGKKFFKTNTSLDFLSYNIKTNALYHGKINNYHLKRKFTKKCSRVVLTSDWLGAMSCYVDNYSVNDKNSKVSILINAFVNAIPGTEKYTGDAKLRFYKHFLEKSGAKLSNNWDSFICAFPQPTKKVLKQVDYKYIDAYMLLNKLKGDKIKRCLHKVKSVNLDSLKTAISLFGEKYLLSKSDEDWVKILEVTDYYHFGYMYRLNEEYSKEEKNRVYQIYRLAVLGEIDFTAFSDHISFKSRLSGINPVKWKSQTKEAFDDEHYEWSEKVSELSKCKYQRFYSEEFKEWTEQIIAVGDKDYYPVLLTNSGEYNFESITQNNCVRTYINKPTSVIVSLRNGSKTSTDKLTIEYSIRCNPEEEDIKLIRVQTKRKSNMQPTEEWDEPVRLMDKRINELCKQKLFTLPKIQVTFSSNTKIESDLSISEEGVVQWENRSVHMGYSFNMYNFDDLP